MKPVTEGSRPAKVAEAEADSPLWSAPHAAPAFTGRCLITDLADDMWTRAVASVLDSDSSPPPPCGAAVADSRRHAVAASARLQLSDARPGDVELRRVWTARQSSAPVKRVPPAWDPESWSRTLRTPSAERFGTAVDSRARGHRRDHAAAAIGHGQGGGTVGDTAMGWQNMDGYAAQAQGGLTRRLQDLPVAHVEVLLFVAPKRHGGGNDSNAAGRGAARAVVAVPLLGIERWTGLAHLDLATIGEEGVVTRRLADAVRRLAAGGTARAPLMRLHQRGDGPVYHVEGAGGGLSSLGGIKLSSVTSASSRSRKSEYDWG